MKISANGEWGVEVAFGKKGLSGTPAVWFGSEADGYHAVRAWLATAAAAVFLLLGSASLNMLAPILQLILDEFKATINFGADLNSVHTLASAAVALPVGWALNRWGFRRIGYAGYIALLGSAVWGATFTGSEGWLLAVRALQGVGYAIPPIIGVYVVAQWFPKDKQAMPIALVASTTSFAKVVALQMSKLAIPLGGWRGQFLVFAALCVVGMLLFVFFMKPGPAYDAAEAERKAKSGKRGVLEIAPLSAAAKNPAIWAVIILFACNSIGQRGWTPFQNMVLVDNCGVSNNTASDINSLLFAMKIASSFLFGLILSSCVKRKGAIIAALITLYFAARAFGFVLDAEWEAWVWALLVGSTGGVAAFCNMCLPEFADSPAVLAMSLSLLTLVGKHAAGVFAPYVFSFVQEATGDWVYCSIPLAAIAVVAIAACWYLALRLDRKGEEVSR